MRIALALGTSLRAYLTAHAHARTGGPIQALREGTRYVAYCPALLPSAEHPPILLPAQSLPPASHGGPSPSP